MRLYRIYTRQTEPVDNQYFAFYYVWAESELSAKVVFNRRFKHAVIDNVFEVNDGPLVLLESGWQRE